MKVLGFCTSRVSCSHSDLGLFASVDRYIRYPTTSVSGFGGKKREMVVGVAAIVTDAGALGGNVSTGRTFTIGDSKLSTGSPPEPTDTARTK